MPGDIIGRAESKKIQDMDIRLTVNNIFTILERMEKDINWVKKKLKEIHHDKPKYEEKF